MNATNRVMLGISGGFTGALSVLAGSAALAMWDNSGALVYPAPSWPFATEARADAWVPQGDHYGACTSGGMQEIHLLVRIVFEYDDLDWQVEPPRVQSDCSSWNDIDHTTDWVGYAVGGCASVFVVDHLEEYYDVISHQWGNPWGCWEMQAYP